MAHGIVATVANERCTVLASVTAFSRFADSVRERRDVRHREVPVPGVTAIRVWRARAGLHGSVPHAAGMVG